MWCAEDCAPGDLIQLLAHEATHLRKPRYKDKGKEELKAWLTGRDAEFAYKAAMDLMQAKVGNQQETGVPR